MMTNTKESTTQNQKFLIFVGLYFANKQTKNAINEQCKVCQNPLKVMIDNSHHLAKGDSFLE